MIGAVPTSRPAPSGRPVAATVGLVAMTPEQFEEFKEVDSLRTSEAVAAGYWSAEEAHQRSREQFQRLVPYGLGTPDQLFFSVVDTEPPGRVVGTVWASVDRTPAVPMLFVHAIDILPEFQGRGRGRALVAALLDHARQLELRRVGGILWESNRRARALYESTGGRAVSTLFHFDIGPNSSGGSADEGGERIQVDGVTPTAVRLESPADVTVQLRGLGPRRDPAKESA